MTHAMPRHCENGAETRERARLTDLVTAIHASRDLKLREADREVLERTIPLVRDGAKTMLDLADATVFVLRQRPLEMPEKAASLLTDETRARLSRLRERLAETQSWQVPALETEIRAFAESESVGIGKFGPALRMCLAAGSPAPDLAGALVALGREESMARLDDVLSPAA